MVARRELSEAQVRQRLTRRQHDPDAVDLAITRLKDEHAIDDQRTAGAIARTETNIKRHGRLRVTRAIEKAGIARATARRAVDEVFSCIDDGTLLETALDRRLRGRATIADAAEFARLYRYLIGQGFESDRVSRLLESRRRARRDD